MSGLRLVEHFVSINGEGQRAGELALFLRFAGCDLDCSWCDTKWANKNDVRAEVTDISQLVQIAEQAIAENGIKNVTLTGGEPLLQPHIGELADALAELGLFVEIETNGAQPLSRCDARHRPSFTMDHKLPSSGMEERMCLDNMALLTESDTLKFVCAGREDLERAAEIIALYRPVCKVYLSPVFGSIDPAEMVEFMKSRKLGDVRLQLQLHKFIWDPEMRGV